MAAISQVNAGQSENPVHLSDLRQTLSIMSSATKSPKERIDYEEGEYEYDSDKIFEEDEDEHLSKSWADQAYDEAGNEVDSLDDGFSMT